MSWVTLARLITSRSVIHCIRVDCIRAVACRSFHSGIEIGPINAGVTNFDTLGNRRNIGRRSVYERISISSQVNVAAYLGVDTEWHIAPALVDLDKLPVCKLVTDGSNELELLDEGEDPIDKLVTCGIDKDEGTEPKLLEAIPVEPNKDEAQKVEPSELEPEPPYIEPGRLELELERIPGDLETTSVNMLIELDVSPGHCEVRGDSDGPSSRDFEINPSELGEFELETAPAETEELQAGPIKPNELELRLVTCELEEAPIEPPSRVVGISCIELSELKLELEPTPEPDSGTPPIELEAKALVTAPEGLDTYPVPCKVEGGPVVLEGSEFEIIPVELNKLELELNACELETALDETGKLKLRRATFEAKPVELRVLEFGLLTGCEVEAKPVELRVLKSKLLTGCEVEAKPVEL
ncbi:uncharacterized protein K444DRAFT_716508 [Hyaloscypha bicolor E]|uniref:Uncharacterized protein n=1 Tax=Hyaloscypha bicolor E TaxID=1095630 RepID=A0A2J6TK85_9HELO|nr:uncharacterized protein K444DRAFT_716508 [Hyaloscypha bicolor E]PMD63424.1 hypothetical protein K444DRAFT_716508 [Hyaloscypha bicolor E]